MCDLRAIAKRMSMHIRHIRKHKVYEHDKYQYAKQTLKELFHNAKLRIFLLPCNHCPTTNVIPDRQYNQLSASKRFGQTFSSLLTNRKRHGPNHAAFNIVYVNLLLNVNSSFRHRHGHLCAFGHVFDGNCTGGDFRLSNDGYIRNGCRVGIGHLLL